MKIILALVAMLCFSAPAWADELKDGDGGWTTTDTIYQATFVGLVLVDWQQTRWVQANMPGFRELNPVIGGHPSRARLNVMAAVGLLGHSAVAGVLPQPYRRYWQCVGIVVEAGAVMNNYNVAGGLRFQF